MSAGLVSRHFGIINPGAVDAGNEIILRAYRLVESGLINSASEFDRCGCRCGFWFMCVCGLFGFLLTTVQSDDYREGNGLFIIHDINSLKEKWGKGGYYIRSLQSLQVSKVG